MDKTKNFIKKAIEIHGDKYDYSKVEYINSRTRVLIICKEHGEFLQMPETHLKGTGCPKCDLTSDKNLQKFIEKSKNVHGDKYDYSKSKYLGSNQKIEIICPEHGSFWMRASAHYSQKQGCPKCGDKKTALANKHTTEDFIKKSNQIHNNYYDYSKTQYINLTSPITIICPIHGEFKQAPREHLQGCGCSKCSKIRIGMVVDTDSFIKKASKIHNNKYDYSKSIFTSRSIKVCIICPEHGEFWQTPNSHLKGQGCPKCGHKITSETQTLPLETVLYKCDKLYDSKYEYIYSAKNYNNLKSIIKIICPKHGEFELPAIRHLHGQECPICTKERRESSGELKIIKILDSLKIDYIFQAELKFLGKLKYDFYLPDLNIAIEYNGKQHYEPVEYFGGEKSFIKQQERDKRKSRLSKENDIELIVIKYNNEKEDFEKMINTIKASAKARDIELVDHVD